MSRNRKIWSGAIAVLVLTAATALTLADIGGNSQIIDIDRDPPQDDPCDCPAIYQPVACKGADGAKHYFSNACVAGCSGYTVCDRVERIP
jgi:hypothetical protein